MSHHSTKDSLWDKFNNWEWSGCIWLFLALILFGWISGQFNDEKNTNSSNSPGSGVYECGDPIFGCDIVIGPDEFDNDYRYFDRYEEERKEARAQMTLDAWDTLADYYASLETAQPNSLTACVNVSRLNVRMGPGLEHGARKSIPKGTCVELIGRNKTADWVQQKDGWMYANMLDIQGRVDSLPVTDTSTSSVPVVTQQYSCSCSGNIFNCSDFSTQASAQRCYATCIQLGYGDIHWLDDDNDGIACELLP